MRLFYFLLASCVFLPYSPLKAQDQKVLLTVLGTVQDAGSPQMACQKACCAHLGEAEQRRRKGSSLALTIENNSAYLFDASPDIALQFHSLQQQGVSDLAGIFLTHAHMGHYAGLLQLGREAWNSKQLPVFAMPRMAAFLQDNAPWEQLIQLKNIKLVSLKEKNPVVIDSGIRVTPIRVPHRDEYSETVAYWIQGPSKSALYLPDIDKWERWETPIEEWIKKVDYAFLDATFYDGSELPNRSMAEIPHPFVVESVDRFQPLSPAEKEKIYFIHLNHTNPLLNPSSKVSQQLLDKGFKVAEKGMEFSL